MKFLDKVYRFILKKEKTLKIITTCVLSVLFVASMAFAILIGGELTQEPALPTDEPRGMIVLNEADYRTSYIVGDQFIFNKENSKVGLYVKTPEQEEVIMIDELPSNEYGFLVNGEGEIYQDAKDILINESVKTIDVVSTTYTNITHSLNIEVLGGIDTTKLTSKLILEGESDANIYRSNKLLTIEQLKSEPDPTKPFISTEGGTVAGTECSGGACLRNFQSNDMKIEYQVVAYEEINVKLTVMICQRTKQGVFSDWYLPKVNGKEIIDVSNQLVPAGSGYFSPYSLAEVIIQLNRGINIITFESGSSVGTSSPANFDAIKIDAPQPVIGDMSVIVRGEAK